MHFYWKFNCKQKVFYLVSKCYIFIKSPNHIIQSKYVVFRRWSTRIHFFFGHYNQVSDKYRCTMQYHVSIPLRNLHTIAFLLHNNTCTSIISILLQSLITTFRFANINITDCVHSYECSCMEISSNGWALRNNERSLPQKYTGQRPDRWLLQWRDEKRMNRASLI